MLCRFRNRVVTARGLRVGEQGAKGTIAGAPQEPGLMDSEEALTPDQGPTIIHQLVLGLDLSGKLRDTSCQEASLTSPKSLISSKQNSES